MGVSLEAARAAVAAQHASQLGLVGIATDPDSPGRIVFHETSGYEWTDRAITVLKDASSGERRGDSAAVLRALVDEPSGLIDQILRRLDADPDTLRTRLDEVQRLRLIAPSPAGDQNLSGSRSVFVPAPIEDVWALLSAPARIPEWDQGIAAVDADDETSGSWRRRPRRPCPTASRCRSRMSSGASACTSPSARSRRASSGSSPTPMQRARIRGRWRSRSNMPPAECNSA